ncbi:MAG TPA: methyltransferase domain-containing protein [Candidatus Acidoferrum sp.]|jgi:SAM-dependent methyltransferase
MRLGSIVKESVSPKLWGHVLRVFRRTVSDIDVYRDELAEKRALEIGGPSSLFGDRGALPIYRALASVDNCLFAAQTIWSGAVAKDFRYHPVKQPGIQFLCDATDLQKVASANYECVLSSHCLEHVANPLRALYEWRRVLNPNGLLLLLLPDKRFTFDWRRPLTPLEHMVSDYESKVREDDLTHLEEILELHDLSRDPLAGTAEQFKKRCVENSVHRAMHQHTFSLESATSILKYAEFRILHAETFKPFHIAVLAQITTVVV